MSTAQPLEVQPWYPEMEEPKEALSDIQLGNLIAAVGNHEGKALLLLAMQVDTPYSKGELHDLVKDLPGAGNAYLGSRGNQLAYCRKSFEPMGLVTKEELGSPTRFVLTQKAEQYGKPLAALLLNFSGRHDIGLENLFGITASRTETRSPAVRLRLIKALIDNPSQSWPEIQQNTGFSNQNLLHVHLLNMSNAGLIQYNPWDTFRDGTKYEILRPDYEPDYRTTAARTGALAYLKAHTTATLDEIVTDYIQSYPDESASPQKIRFQIAKYLNRLARNGVLEIFSSPASGQDIKVEFNEAQKLLWSELLTSLDRFARQDPVYLSDLNRKVANLLSDSFLVASALNRAAETSSKAQNGTEKALGRLALKILTNSQTEMSVRDIATSISELEKRKVSMPGIQAALFELAKDNVVESSKKGSALRYKLASPAKRAVAN